MNGSGVQPHRLLEATEVSSRCSTPFACRNDSSSSGTKTGDHYLVLSENRTPNLANIGVIASMILILVVDFKIATSRNLL